MSAYHCLIVLLLAIAFSAVSASQDSSEWEAPWFCHDLDCPKFKVAKNLTEIGVEMRQYDAGTSVICDVSDTAWA